MEILSNTFQRAKYFIMIEYITKKLSFGALLLSGCFLGLLFQYGWNNFILVLGNAIGFNVNHFSLFLSSRLLGDDSYITNAIL